MPTFDTDSIQEVLDKITRKHQGNKNFVSVEFSDTGNIIVRYSDVSITKVVLPSSFSVRTVEQGIAVDVPVRTVSGSKIIPFFGDKKLHPPFERENSAGQSMGGDICENVNWDQYGTITLYAGSIEVRASGRCNQTAKAGPALLSCNHVIARNDAAQLGEVINALPRVDVARLAGFIRFPCNGDVDVAVAKVNDVSVVSKWTVQTIGNLAGVRRPNIGETVKKHGARTGYTVGRVTGQLNIVVNGYTFHGVFSIGGGFSSPGDSGAAIVAGNNDLLGMLSWGDDTPSKQLPASYFYTFINPGLRENSTDYSAVELTFG